MAAMVETMFYTRQKPWHGLGVRVMEAPTSKSALVLSGLNWKVVQEDIYTDSGNKVDGFKANVRDVDSRILGVVSDRNVVKLSPQTRINTGFLILLKSSNSLRSPENWGFFCVNIFVSFIFSKNCKKGLTKPPKSAAASRPIN